MPHRPQQQAITAAAADLPRIWHASSTTAADRKQIIRAVLDEITVLARGRTELVDLTHTWAGGQTSRITARRPLQRMEDLSYHPELAARIGELSDAGMTPESIVIRLHDEGFRHARGDRDIGWHAVEQVLLRTGHAINPAGSTPTKHHTTTSGGWQTWPPNSASPSAPSTAGSGKDD